MTGTRSYVLEHRLTLVRWAGVAAGTVAVASSPNLASAERWLGWGLVAALAAANVVLWQWARPKRQDRPDAHLELATFAFDAAIITGFTLLFAANGAGPVWALTLVIPLEGALRRGMPGGLAGAAIAVLVGGAFVLRSASGRTFDLETFVVIAAVAAAIGFVSGAVSDEWKRRRRAFEHQTARLAELDRLKDRYIAVTSHEIRGPLTAMMAAVETVRARWDSLPEDRRSGLLDMVFLQGRQLDRLVEDLMISAEVQAGGLTMHPEWSELEPVVRRALDAAAVRRRAHTLEVFVDPVRCEIDTHRVSQIIRNLVENSYKYTPDRTKVAVTAKAVADGIVLEVADDGEGIPAEKRDQLFEAFSRIEETAAGQEGVGLGLYVVSQLVAAMDGRIDLASSSRGTTFSIFIPCRTVPISTPHIGLVPDGDEQASG